MLGYIILILLLIVEIGFDVISLCKNASMKREKSIIHIIVFISFLILILSPAVKWSFPWYGLGALLFFKALFGGINLLKKQKNSNFKRRKLILGGIGRCLLITLAVFPAILFIEYQPIKPTGEYSVGTMVYSWTDKSREEYFTPSKDHRKVTVQFFYPSNEKSINGEAKSKADIAKEGKYPLILFSHGAFGYRRSNTSTYMELASHGYIVCSIDHTYHAFMTKEEDGTTILADKGFINEVMQLQNGKSNEKESYQIEQKWLKLRLSDMKFVLNHIKELGATNDSDVLFHKIDFKHIGAFGHSLGGAAAAQLGRDNKDIDAVIVLDGTMLGEKIGFIGGKEILNKEAYPKPIMNFYNESHYKEAISIKDTYANMVAAKYAKDSYQVVINGTGHLNFTDLPLRSPILAGMLGTGNINARNCIITINKTVLEFFDHYLKNNRTEIPKERLY